MTYCSVVTVLTLVGLRKKCFHHYAVLKILSLRSPSMDIYHVGQNSGPCDLLDGAIMSTFDRRMRNSSAEGGGWGEGVQSKITLTETTSVSRIVYLNNITYPTKYANRTYHLPNLKVLAFSLDMILNDQVPAFPLKIESSCK